MEMSPISNTSTRCCPSSELNKNPTFNQLVFFPQLNPLTSADHLVLSGCEQAQEREAPPQSVPLSARCDPQQQNDPTWMDATLLMAEIISPSPWALQAAAAAPQIQAFCSPDSTPLQLAQDFSSALCCFSALVIKGFSEHFQPYTNCSLPT